LKWLLAWLVDLHAPLGRWSPFAAAACFAASRFVPSAGLRILLVCTAGILALLISADLARGLLDRQPATSAGGRAVPEKDAPLTVVQMVFVGVVASVYTAMIFVGVAGINPLISIFLLPLIFVLACLAARRNVKLWYQQGAEYEQELKQAEVQQAQRERLKEMRMDRRQ
jgi:hypothetical protein